MKPLYPDMVPAATPDRSKQKRMPGLKRAAVDASELSSRPTVIAFDPGGTTGWALYTVRPEALSNLDEHRDERLLDNVIKWEHGQVDCGSTKGNLGTSLHPGVSTSGENAGIDELVGLVRAWPGAAIVIEDFILDPSRFNTGRDLLSPVRITAPLSYMLWLQRRAPFFQSASLAKSTVTDERLKRWGYYSSTGGLNHARDADRHALTFLRRCANPTRESRELREAAWPHIFAVGGKYHNSGRRKEDGLPT